MRKICICILIKRKFRGKRNFVSSEFDSYTYMENIIKNRVLEMGRRLAAQNESCIINNCLRARECFENETRVRSFKSAGGRAENIKALLSSSRACIKLYFTCVCVCSEQHWTYLTGRCFMRVRAMHSNFFGKV